MVRRRVADLAQLLQLLLRTMGVSAPIACAITRTLIHCPRHSLLLSWRLSGSSTCVFRKCWVLRATPACAASSNVCVPSLYYRGGAEPDRDHASLRSCEDSCARFQRRRVASMSWSRYVSGGSTVSSAKHTHRRSPTTWGFLCCWYVHRDLAITTRRHFSVRISSDWSCIRGPSRLRRRTKFVEQISIYFRLEWNPCYVLTPT